MNNPSALEKQSAIAFESVLIQSDRNPVSVDVANSVTDLDIFEHLDKPYLTGMISFLDTEDIVGGLDISGAETVDIKVRVNSQIAVSVKKTFYITKIITTGKGSTTGNAIVLHLIEDVAYKSNLFNVNKSYSGSPTDIINKISKSYLNKTILTSSKDTQDFKVIVPNLTPLNAMSWIKNKATTTKGYPFYLFSTFGQDELLFADLKTMMERPAVNVGEPYTYTESTIPSVDDNYSDKPRRRTILHYDYNNTENLFELIGKGVVGARHNYIDITKNEIKSIDFDLAKDVIKTFQDDGEVKKSPLFSSMYNLDGKSFNRLQSRVISQIGGTDAFENQNTFSENKSKGMYKLNSISRAMYGLLMKQPIKIRVNGIDFLQTEGNNTIGNKLDIKFLRNIVDQGASDNRLDPKKSGHFLLLTAKHAFRREGYDISFTGVKLSNGDV